MGHGNESNQNNQNPESNELADRTDTNLQSTIRELFGVTSNSNNDFINSLREKFDHFWKHNVSPQSRKTANQLWNEVVLLRECKSYEFEILYSRLLWTHDVFEQSNIEPQNVLEFFPDNKSDFHFEHKDWLYEYAYHGHRLNKASSSEVLSKLSNMRWEKEEPDPKELGVHKHGLDVAFVEHQLLNQANALRSGVVSLLSQAKLSSFVERVERIVAETQDNIIALVKVKHANLRILKVPRPAQSPFQFQSHCRVFRLIEDARHLIYLRSQIIGINVAMVYSVKGPEPFKKKLDSEEMTARVRFSLAQDSIYVEMEYYEEGTLADRIRNSSNGRLSNVDSADIAYQLATMITAAHHGTLQHRDLKPSNCFFKDGKLVLSDFGISKLSDMSAPGDGNQLGTAPYMAPEQFKPNQQLTVQVDVWAIGVILYEMLTGKLPFPGTTRDEVRQKIDQAKPEKPTAINNAVSVELESLCFQCFALDPNSRIIANVLADKLSSWLRVNSKIAAEKRKFAWNPDLIEVFTSKRWTFLLFDLMSASHHVMPEIERILNDAGCSIYRIYRVFGEYHLLIRCSMRRESLEELVRRIDCEDIQVRPVTKVIPLQVVGFMHHWYWSVAKSEIDISTETLVDLEQQLQHTGWENSQEAREAVSGGLLRLVHEHDDKKIFFLFIRRAILRVERKELLKHVKGVLEGYLSINLGSLQEATSFVEANSTNFVDSEKSMRVSHLSVYELSNEMLPILVKAEVSDFFEIGNFVSAISSGLGALGGTTMTLIVADTDVVGQENLASHEFSLKPTTKLIKEELPLTFREWKVLIEQGYIVDESHLEFASKVVCDLSLKLRKRFYKAIRHLLDRILARCLIDRPVVDVMGRTLTNIAVAAQLACDNLKIPREGNQSKDLLLAITNHIAKSWPAGAPSDFKDELDRLTFDGFDELAGFCAYTGPNDAEARTYDSIVKLISLLEEIWTIEMVWRASKQSRPLFNMSNITITSDDPPKPR